MLDYRNLQWALMQLSVHLETLQITSISLQSSVIEVSSLLSRSLRIIVNHSKQNTTWLIHNWSSTWLPNINLSIRPWSQFRNWMTSQTPYSLIDHAVHLLFYAQNLQALFKSVADLGLHFKTSEKLIDMSDQWSAIDCQQLHLKSLASWQKQYQMQLLSLKVLITDNTCFADQFSPTCWTEPLLSWQLQGSNVKLSVGYPLDTDTPGLANENLTKVPFRCHHSRSLVMNFQDSHQLFNSACKQLYLWWWLFLRPACGMMFWHLSCRAPCTGTKFDSQRRVKRIHIFWVYVLLDVICKLSRLSWNVFGGINVSERLC